MKFVLIFLIILFIPIPISFTVNFENKNLTFYLYKYKLPFNRKNKTEKIKEIIAKKRKERLRAKKEGEKNKKGRVGKHKRIDILKLINNLNKNSFKPKIQTCVNISYSLDDAMKTAIFYGVIYKILSAFNMILCIPFKLKIKEQNVNPVFKDELNFKMNIKSIIIVNLAKAIYIIFLILRSLKIGGESNGKKSSNRKSNDQYNGKS